MTSMHYQPPLEINALREYVTGASHMQRAADTTVQVYITHNHLRAQFPEIRLDLHVSSHNRLEGAGHQPRALQCSLHLLAPACVCT